MFKNILKKLRSDRGDGSLVSIIIVLPLLLGILFTIIDISAYFANRAYMQTVAHNGARTVSIMGGNGTANRATPIEMKYGLVRDTICGQVEPELRAGSIDVDPQTSIECNMMVQLQEATGLINVTVTGVSCTPSSTSSIGQRVKCEVTWSYGGTPGSLLALIPPRKSADGTLKHFAEENITAGSSESEVDLNGALVWRK